MQRCALWCPLMYYVHGAGWCSSVLLIALARAKLSTVDGEWIVERLLELRRSQVVLSQ